MADTIVCENVTKKYKDKLVLDHIDLKLEAGKIYGLIGRNGAGKTTLLSIMSAQNPATSGSVSVCGMPVWENREALKHVCFSRELMPGNNNGVCSLKVKDYFDAAGYYYPDWDKEMAARLVQKFGLDKKKRMNKLSKGMLSMVTIIVALASKAQFTFMDEPVAGLDIIARELFYKEMLEEFAQTGRTFVISSHILEEAADVFEETIIVHKGQILLQEDTQQLVGRAYSVNGPAELVESLFSEYEHHAVHGIGRSKSAVLLLKEGQSAPDHDMLTIQKMNLQNIFVALCGEE